MGWEYVSEGISLQEKLSPYRRYWKLQKLRVVGRNGGDCSCSRRRMRYILCIVAFVHRTTGLSFSTDVSQKETGNVTLIFRSLQLPHPWRDFRWAINLRLEDFSEEDDLEEGEYVMARHGAVLEARLACSGPPLRQSDLLSLQVSHKGCCQETGRGVGRWRILKFHCSISRSDILR